MIGWTIDTYLGSQAGLAGFRIGAIQCLGWRGVDKRIARVARLRERYIRECFGEWLIY
jgi:hypothetical protein